MSLVGWIQNLQRLSATAWSTKIRNHNALTAYGIISFLCPYSTYFKSVEVSTLSDVFQASGLFIDCGPCLYLS